MASVMKCAEITLPGGRLKITTREVPGCPEKGILVRTLYGGICHSDVHFNDDVMDLGNGATFRNSDVLGDNFKGTVLGHEIAGVVHEIGKCVSTECNLNVGDKVFVYTFIGCCKPTCLECQAGEYQICRETKGGTTTIGQGEIPGGFGNWIPVPDWKIVIKVPPSMPHELSTMLPCSGVTTYSALIEIVPKMERILNIRKKANILIIGVGGLGMWLMYIARILFKEKNVKITCADLSQSKLDLAKHMGADETVEWSSGASVTDTINTTTQNGALLFDFTFDFVGLPRTVDIGISCLANLGEATIIGLRGGQYPLSLPTMISKSIAIRGLRVGSLNRLLELVELIGDNSSSGEYPSYHLVKLEDVNDVFEKLKKNELIGRAIIKHEAIGQNVFM